MIPVFESLEEVRYIEEDFYIHEDSVYAAGETVAASMSDANGNTYSDFPYPREVAHSCSDPNAMKVAIVDGGTSI